MMASRALAPRDSHAPTTASRAPPAERQAGQRHPSPRSGPYPVLAAIPPKHKITAALLASGFRGPQPAARTEQPRRGHVARSFKEQEILVSTSRTSRRLRNAVFFAAARGAAAAAGSSLVGLVFWWITHHH